jgi:hypothetical protein
MAGSAGPSVGAGGPGAERQGLTVFKFRVQLRTARQAGWMRAPEPRRLSQAPGGSRRESMAGSTEPSMGAGGPGAEWHVEGSRLALMAGRARLFVGASRC